MFTFLACFGHFLDLFGQFNQSRAPIFPCVPREFRGPDAPSCPYYARRPEKFSAQSRSYAEHVRHNCVFSQSGHYRTFECGSVQNTVENRTYAQIRAKLRLSRSVF